MQQQTAEMLSQKNIPLAVQLPSGNPWQLPQSLGQNPHQQCFCESMVGVLVHPSAEPTIPQETHS
jgi:hypothetical protein